MAFPGIKERQAREDIVAYLKALSEGKAPAAASAPSGMMGMMGSGRMPNLKQADRDSQVQGLRHCRDTYFVTTADGKIHKVWEFNLRFKTDTSENGPNPGKPVILGAGMRGDRAVVVFAAASEFGNFIKERCE